jgi:membrane associated rhomboid family serine protease
MSHIARDRDRVELARRGAGSHDPGMLIPIGHDQALRRRPWATFGIVIACTLVQVYIAATGNDEAVELGLGHVSNSGLGLTLLTSAFVHGGWLHLIGNMLFLVLAGSPLEDRWGRPAFLGFYLAGAAVSALVFDALHAGDPVLLVGASGAIAAVMGAFLLFFARAKIRLWYWMVRSSGTFELAAYYALPLWLLDQVVMGQIGGGGAVAYNAHIGGFAFGVAAAGLVALVRRRPDAEHAPEARRSQPAARPVAGAVTAAPAQVPARPISPSAAPAPIVVAGLTALPEAPIVAKPGAAEPTLLR